mmetsp:Transcript_65688/g.207858  ORF Transcript_65688/g.207858 Transcript_65688/m.207858 type:complete len:153 (-) Transcript_65688:204-662(-)
MTRALEIIREAAGPGTHIAGCGCPVGPAVGLVDSMRVSADTGLAWHAEFPMLWNDRTNLPSVRVMMRNTLTRSSMHGRWWQNNGDCLLLRDATRQSVHTVRAVATVLGMCGSVLFVSDDLALVTPERRHIVQSLLPVLDFHLTRTGLGFWQP